MQVFSKFKSVHDLEYVTKSYLYLNENEEDIKSIDDINLLLKKKNKNVAGTIFFYNPTTIPLGFKSSEKLSNQDFIFDDNFWESSVEEGVRIFGKVLRKKFPGQLVEIKYLFSYIKENIQPTSVLEVFELDLEKLNTNQLTVFAKNDNYHDFKNISYNGRFIFFAWGHKFDKHHTNISTYASNIAHWASKTDKEISFMYDGVQNLNDSFEYTRFINPVAFGKLKLIIPEALKIIFSKEIIEPLCIKNMV